MPPISLRWRAVVMVMLLLTPAASGAALPGAAAPGRPASEGVAGSGALGGEAEAEVSAFDEVAEVAAAVRERITTDGLMEQTAAIVEHERPSGSPGEFAAIDHIVSVLEGDGVPVEVHSFQAYVSDPQEAIVEIGGLEATPDAITVSFSATVEGLEAPLIDVGSVEDLPRIDTATGELLALEVGGGYPDVAGAIALVDGLPMPGPAWVLEQLGAVGAIFVNPEERLNELIITTVWGTPSLRNAHRIPNLPVAEVSRQVGEAIRAVPPGAQAPVRLTTRAPARWTELRLPVATVRSPVEDAPFVLLGGHIDSWYHGANDEGASNAAMLELARAFHAVRDRLRRNLVVAWWPGHSNGRYAGSTWYADRFYGSLMQDAVAYLNIDGVGQQGAERFSATATASLEGLARTVAMARVERDIPVTRPGRNSDQAFNGIGLPLLQFNHRGEYWWWHTPEDTLDKVDPDTLATDTDLYLEALSHLLVAGELPVDLAAEVDALATLLRERQERAGETFDLTGGATATLLERLRGTVAEIEDARFRAAPAADVDRGAVAVLRPLHRVVYTQDGPHHPDPAVEMGLLPGLEPIEDLVSAETTEDRRGFAEATLQRELNRLHEALYRAHEQGRWLLRALSE